MEGRLRSYVRDSSLSLSLSLFSAFVPRATACVEPCLFRAARTERTRYQHGRCAAAGFCSELQRDLHKTQVSWSDSHC